MFGGRGPRAGRLNGWILGILIGSLVGCAGPSSVSLPSNDIDEDVLYPWGATRDDLETKYGAGRLIYIVNEVPRDEFAAAAVKEMVSLRRPRAVSYEVFVRRNFGTGGEGYYSDYVFFNDQNRVLYAARRIPGATTSRR
jgi:hypothetical protein